MTTTLITNIGELVTCDSSLGEVDGDFLGVLHDAALVIDGERIAWVGEAANAPDADNRVDAGGCAFLD